MGIPISNVTRRVVYEASGTGPYNFTFEILASTDVAVYRDDTLLTLTTDYTVTINANGTGYITLVASPTGADQIAIVGNRTIQRTTDFVTGGDFFANTVNDEMDQQTIFAQQNAEGLQRALQAPQTDPTTIDMTLPRASVRANKTLAFDTDGNPTTGEVIGDNRGNWASGTAYNKRDIVKDTSNGNVYYANTAHTSTGAQPISSNTDSAKWDLIVDNASAGASATDAAASASAAATSASNASTSASNAASSASTASTQASNASTSATNAANSATAAASSASTASTAATNAGNSATAAATSATNASNSASSASTSATNASNSATSASTSASNASTSATAAASSASTASTQASNAATSATNAANSATASASSATAAAASAAAAAASFDAFDDIYLGAKSSDPTVDNDGNALTVGDQYFNTVANELRVYNGSTWQAASTVGGTVTSLSVTGATTLAQNPTLSAGTANGVAYLNASKVLTTGSALTFDGAQLGVNGITVGRGAGAVSTNTAVGASALDANTTGASNTGVGYQALLANTDGTQNTAVGRAALTANTSGGLNAAFGRSSLLANTTGSYNTAVGGSALASNTTASYNTATGYQALYGNTAGAANSAFGDAAMFANTTGQYNVAVGMQALQANTTASNNVAVGYQAAYSNTAGYSNVAVGSAALQSNSTASANTAIGESAANRNTTGASNVSVGSYSLFFNTTGGSNVAVGAGVYGVSFGALGNNTTGSGNTAVGMQALYSNTTASNNTAVGYQALYLNTTGTYNTAVGYLAGAAQTTGSQSVFVGYQAGKSASGDSQTIIGGAAGQSITTGNANTIVGSAAGASLTTGSRNTIVGPNTGSSAAGYLMTTGTANTILGAYNGNQGGLDIRTANNYVVLSDGDGNPRLINRGGTLAFGVGANPSNWFSGLPVHQLGSASWLGSSTQSLMSLNYYTDGASDKFIQDGPATTAYQYNGAHQLWGTDSGLAGSTISWTNLFTVKKGNTVALQGGSTGVAGTGITFPATQNASSDANTLDDYEEGTWTPTIAFGGGTTGITYSYQSGSYTKVGRQVTAYFNLQFSNKGSSTGTATLGGFPFTTSSGTRGGGSVTYAQSYNAIANMGGFLFLVESSNTIASLRYFNTSTRLSQNLTDAEFTNSTEYWGEFTYFV